MENGHREHRANTKYASRNAYSGASCTGGKEKRWIGEGASGGQGGPEVADFVRNYNPARARGRKREKEEHGFAGISRISRHRQ